MQNLSKRLKAVASLVKKGSSVADVGTDHGYIPVYLIENDRMASIAIRLSKECHGKGYGTESLSAMTRFCFENTELQRIWTDVDVKNIGSCKVLEKCGFTKEGTIRQGKMVSSWCDYHLYAILKSDIASYI